MGSGLPASPTKLRIPGLLAGKGTPPQPPNGTVLGDYLPACARARFFLLF